MRGVDDFELTHKIKAFAFYANENTGPCILSLFRDVHVLNWNRGAIKAKKWFLKLVSSIFKLTKI